jgi:GPN-loop GTPase
MLTQALDAAAVEFERDYLPDLQERIAATEKQKQAARDREMAKLMKDVSLTRQDKIVAGRGSAADNDTTAADASDSATA